MIKPASANIDSSNMRHSLTNLVTISFIGFLGISIGFYASFLTFRYFIPFWSYIEITPNEFFFHEITAVDYVGMTSESFAEDRLILETTPEKYWLFSQGSWQPIALENFDLSDFNTQSSSCDGWALKPPPTYLRKIADSHGIEIESPLATDLRCYVLLENGKVQIWMRHINVFHVLFVFGAGLFAGFCLVAVMLAKYRKFELSRTL